MRFIDNARGRWSNNASFLFTKIAAKAMDISVNRMFDVLGIVAKRGRTLAGDGDYPGSLRHSDAICDLAKMYKSVAESWIDGHNDVIADLDEVIAIAGLASRLAVRMIDDEEE